MGKQSKAKEKQGYKPQAACCANCAHFRCDTIAIPAQFSWSEPYELDKNLRCHIGGFAVKKSGHCTFFAWAPHA